MPGKTSSKLIMSCRYYSNELNRIYAIHKKSIHGWKQVSRPVGNVSISTNFPEICERIKKKKIMIPLNYL